MDDPVSGLNTWAIHRFARLSAWGHHLRISLKIICMPGATLQHWNCSSSQSAVITHQDLLATRNLMSGVIVEGRSVLAWRILCSCITDCSPMSTIQHPIYEYKSSACRPVPPWSTFTHCTDKVWPTHQLLHNLQPNTDLLWMKCRPNWSIRTSKNKDSVYGIHCKIQTSKHSHTQAKQKPSHHTIACWPVLQHSQGRTIISSCQL